MHAYLNADADAEVRNLKIAHDANDNISVNKFFIRVVSKDTIYPTPSSTLLVLKVLLI